MQPEQRAYDVAEEAPLLEIPAAWSELENWLADLEQAALNLVSRIDPVLDGSHQLDTPTPAKADAPIPSRTAAAGKIRDQTAAVMRVTAMLQRAEHALAL